MINIRLDLNFSFVNGKISHTNHFTSDFFISSPSFEACELISLAWNHIARTTTKDDAGRTIITSKSYTFRVHEEVKRKVKYLGQKWKLFLSFLSAFLKCELCKFSLFIRLLILRNQTFFRPLGGRFWHDVSGTRVHRYVDSATNTTERTCQGHVRASPAHSKHPRRPPLQRASNDSTSVLVSFRTSSLVGWLDGRTQAPHPTRGKISKAPCFLRFA